MRIFHLAQILHFSARPPQSILGDIGSQTMSGHWSFVISHAND
jgi:hypothetical protein